MYGSPLDAILFECRYTIDYKMCRDMLKSPFTPALTANLVLMYISFAMLVFSGCFTVFAGIVTGYNLMFIMIGVLLFFVGLTRILYFPSVRGYLVFKKMSQGKGPFGCITRFDGEKVITEDETGDKRSYYYSNITAVLENEYRYNLLIDNRLLLCIPKNCFVYGDPAAFGGFIRSAAAQDKFSSRAIAVNNVMKCILITMCFILTVIDFIFLVGSFMPMDYPSVYTMLGL